MIAKVLAPASTALRTVNKESEKIRRGGGKKCSFFENAYSWCCQLCLRKVKDVFHSAFSLDHHRQVACDDQEEIVPDTILNKEQTIFERLCCTTIKCRTICLYKGTNKESWENRQHWFIVCFCCELGVKQYCLRLYRHCVFKENFTDRTSCV